MKLDMRNPKITLAVAPTHRHHATFTAEAPKKQKEAIFLRLRELGIEFVDLDDVCPYGLVSTNEHVEAAEKKFYRVKPDALFIPFVDFGSEGTAAQLASKFDVPVLLWGQRDRTGQGNDGDIQCGIIAAGKVFRQFKKKFTFFPTCYLEDEMFERGIRAFLAVANVVKTFRNCYILQVGPRPEPFWSVMCNEGTLLSEFGIRMYPVTISDMVRKTREILEKEPEAVEAIVTRLKERADIRVKDPIIYKSAALKLAVDYYRELSHTNCCSFQCWTSLQSELGIWPCVAMSLLNEEGYPTICENDVQGTISCLLSIAAAMGQTTPMLADWCFRHPTIEHAEFVAHCGQCSMELFVEKPRIVTRNFPYAKDMGAHVCGPIHPGKVTFFRFDGDSEGYSMLLGTAESFDEGDTCKRGSRIWLQMPDVKKLERHLVYGPYIHHVAITHGDITPVLLESIKYLPGVKADFVYKEQEEAAMDYWLCESMPNGPEGMVVVPGEAIID